jgi:hypothetical protein
MKKCMHIAALLSSVFGCALALHAESAVTIHAPFEFVAAGKTMPAGDYRMEMLTPGVVLIAGQDSGSRVLAMVNLSEGSTTPAVAFDSSNSTHVLTSVTSSGGTWNFVGAAPAHVAVALRSKK